MEKSSKTGNIIPLCILLFAGLLLIFGWRLFWFLTDGMNIHYGNYPIAVAPCVGVLSWVFPKINFIDLLGLNDYVIARHQGLRPHVKKMAHERQPPEGYIECFNPNVIIELRTGRIAISFRDKELTAEDIMQCERKWTQIVKGSRNAS